jgi:hypothetical protein
MHDVQKTFAEALTELLAEYAGEPSDALVAALKDALRHLEPLPNSVS